MPQLQSITGLNALLGGRSEYSFKPGDLLGIQNEQSFNRFIGIDKSLAFDRSQTIIPAVPPIPGTPRKTVRVFGKTITIWPGTPPIGGIPATSVGLKTERGDRVRLGLDISAGYNLGGVTLKVNTDILNSLDISSVTPAKSLSFSGFDKPLFLVGYDAPRAYANLDLVTDLYFNPSAYASVIGKRVSANLFSINTRNRTNLVSLDTGDVGSVSIAYNPQVGRATQSGPSATGTKTLNSNRGGGPLSKLENMGITINSSLPTADELLRNVSLTNSGQVVTASLTGESTLLSLNADLAQIVNSFFPALPINVSKNFSLAGVNVGFNSKLISANASANLNLGYNISASLNPNIHIAVEGSSQKQKLFAPSGSISLAAGRDANNDGKLESFLGFDPELTLSGRVFVKPKVDFGASFLSGGVSAGFMGKSIGFSFGPVYSTPRTTLFSTQFDVFKFSKTFKLDHVFNNDASFKISEYTGVSTSPEISVSGQISAADAKLKGSAVTSPVGAVNGLDANADYAYDSYLFTVAGNDIGTSLARTGLKLTATSASSAGAALSDFALRVRDFQGGGFSGSSLDDYAEAKTTTAAAASITDISFRSGVGAKYIVDVIYRGAVPTSDSRGYTLWGANGTLSQLNAA